ncbi:sigma-70 family RNA polymerase sigma factor [Candidatus Poribacteria bacterium]|nr:sigma-70 family RNA polymerase sigma factor [Candidatus Poribacteria bacterium]
MINNDVQLIHRCIEGDDSAFSEIVEKYQRQVHALVWKKIGDFHFAEELTQDTFLRAYQQLKTLKKPQLFAGWLYVIASNLCNTWLRNKNIRSQLHEKIDSTQYEESTYSNYVALENKRSSAENQRLVVEKLLAKLKESERTVMTLHYYGDMSCKEIGDFLGVSVNTVKSRLHRAQQRFQKDEGIIREALENYQFSPSLTDTIMKEISRTKPVAPVGSNPLMPWVMVTSTIAVVLLILGFGGKQLLTLFHHPYTFDDTAETAVEIIDSPIIANIESNPVMRKQIGNVNALDENKKLMHQHNDVSTLSLEEQAEETMEENTQWHLPKEAKARLGKGKVNDIKFSPDGKHLVVGTSMGVWLYDANTGEEIILFSDVGDENNRLDRTYINMLVSPTDGNIIPCDSLEGNSDRYTLFRLKEDSLKSILPDLRRPNNVLQFHGRNIKLSYSGWTMNLPWHWTPGMWNLGDDENKSIVGNLSINDHSEMQIAISPDDRFLAAALNDRAWKNKYMIPALQVWDRTIGKSVFTIKESKHKIETITFSPDSKTLAYSESNNIVKIWDIGSNSLQYMFKAGVPFQILTFTPDGSHLISGSLDGIVRFWKVPRRGTHSIYKRVFNNAIVKRPNRMLIGHADNSKFISIHSSQDGKKIASANYDGTIRLWDTDSGNQQFTLTQHLGTQTALAFNSMNQSKQHVVTNRTLTSIGLNNFYIFVSVWNIDTGDRISIDMVDKDNHKNSEVAISPEGSLFVTNDWNAVRLWDSESGDFLCVLGEKEKRGGFQAKVVFSPDGKLLAVSSREDNTIQIWDVSKRQTLCKLEGHTTYVYSLAFSPDNKTVVSSGWTYKDKTIRIWDPMTGAEIQTLQDQGKIAFPPNSNNTFAAGRHIYSQNPETNSFEAVIRLEGIGYNDPPTSLTFSPDGSTLVSGSRHGYIELRSATTGKINATLNGHTSWISDLVFSPDGKTLVSTGEDGTILVWNWDEVIN